MEIIQRETDRWRLFSQEWRFGNGWALSVVDLDGSGPEIAILRQDETGYHLIRHEQLLEDMVSLYTDITDVVIDWPFGSDGICRFDDLLDAAVYWSKIISRFPYNLIYTEGGNRMVFRNPFNGSLIDGSVNEKGRSILCQYFLEKDDDKARETLGVLCDALQDSPA